MMQELVLNFWQGVTDPVAERSMAFYPGGVSVALFTVGLGIIPVGVFYA